MQPLPSPPVQHPARAQSPVVSTRANPPTSTPSPAPLSSPTSHRRSFLPKLPSVTLPKRIPRPPHPRRFIPSRFSRAKLYSSSDVPSASPIAILAFRVLAARDLSQDVVSTSETYLHMRYGATRVVSPPVPTSNAVWNNGTGAGLEVAVYDNREFGREKVEVVCWLKDRGGKTYLGEVSLSVDRWWGDQSGWKDGVPPLGFNDVDNKPVWHAMQSSKSRATVSGALLIQVGFVAPSAITGSPATSITSRGLSWSHRAALLVVLQTWVEEREGSRRASKEERIMMSQPTEGVGTHRLDEHVGMAPTAYAESGSESDSTSESEPGGEEEEELEEEEEEELELFADAAAAEAWSSELAINTPPFVLSPPQSPIANRPPTSSEAATPLLSPIPQSPSDLVPSTSTPFSASTPISQATSTPTIVSARKGISIPFFKRTSSSKSVPTNTNLTVDSEPGSATSDTADGSPAATLQEKKRRFSRKKVVRPLTSDGPPLPESGETSRSRKKTQSAGGRVSKRTAKRAEGKGFRYDEDVGISGLVQIEVKGAKGLPKMSNMLKTGWDMDPFVVVSCGRKVFRTRVIRHNLNPTWDEKLFFHVRRTEAQWVVAFGVYDWDKLSANDHVGDVSVPLEQLLGTTIQPDERGLYPVDAEGKLVGDDFHDHSLSIQVVGTSPGESPTLQIRAKYTPYDALRQQLWRAFLKQYDIDESGAFSHLEIFSMLDSLGSTLSKETISSFFTRFGKSDDQELTGDEVVLCLEHELRKQPGEKRQAVTDVLESGMVTPLGSTASGGLDPFALKDKLAGSSSVSMEVGGDTKSTALSVASGSMARSADSGDSSGTPSDDTVERVINIKECPLCHKPRLNSKAEMDIFTHMGICSSTDSGSVNRMIVGNFVTASQAQRKWFTKVISKATKGAYSLGANSANIIVQDRQTGMLQEEKIAVYVRLGIRLAYKGMGAGGGMEGARIRRMLESMSYKQGVKFNSPSSVREIQPFIEFHALSMDDVLQPLSSFKTFNEFFSRKLKPDARPVSDPSDPHTLVSPADCRAMFFQTVDEATKIWIKGRDFSIQRLLGEPFKDKASLYEGGSLAIFRLSPQDYHRFHSPVDGVCGPIHKIAGQYYTVNPMAIRSSIDVYGENVRTLGAVQSPVFGEVMSVWVGAMLVASTFMTVAEGDTVKRGEEVGYFEFGGSTIVVLFPPGSVKFDEDLLANSKNSLETLVRMGTRIGRSRK